MGNTFGRQVLSQTGSPIQVTADGRPEWDAGGVTIDWSLVAAVAGTPAALPEGISVAVGQKYLRFGQVLAKVTSAETITITVTGTPTGGSFNMGVVRPDTGFSTVVTVPFNSSVANTQALLDAVLGAGNSVVSGAGALPGNVQTVTAAGILVGTPIPNFTLAANNLIGGASPTAAFAVASNANTGKWGPYDFAATDGRQTLTAGNCGILNETVLENGITGLWTTQPTNHVGVLVGGRVWEARIIQSGTGTHSLAAGPTKAELIAALPRLLPITN